MSTVKISELPTIPRLNEDTTQTLIAGVDIVAGVTGKMTAKVLAESLYSHDTLNVGNNSVVLPNTAAQFAASSNNYVQVNLQNNEANGSADYVITADSGTDSTYYIDMGFNGSTYSYDGYTYAKPLDGYLIVQGNDNTTPGGNLVVGTTTAGKDVSILVGSIDDSKIMAKFVANTGLKMLEYPYYFSDGTSQNTAATPFAQGNASFLQANSAFLKSNGAFIQANMAYIKANNALANTSGTFNGNLNVNGTIKIKNGPTFEYAPTASPATWLITSDTPLGVVSDLTVSGNTAVNYKLTVQNASMPGNTAFLSVIGSSTYATQPASNPGYMIHTTGIDGQASRIVGDAFSNTATHYSAFIGRRGRGTAASPLPVQSGDVIARFAGNAYGDTKFSQFGDGRIEVVAAGNHSDTSKPTKIVFLTTASGANAASQVAEFNGNTVTFTGTVNPQKGFVWTSRIPAGNQTAITIDYSTDSIVKANCVADVTISHSNYVAGKIVEVWLTNNDNSNHTVTHGCAALRSTNKSTTFTITAGSSAYLRYFSIDGDNANTFVTVTA